MARVSQRRKRQTVSLSPFQRGAEGGRAQMPASRKFHLAPVSPLEIEISRIGEQYSSFASPSSVACPRPLSEALRSSPGSQSPRQLSSVVSFSSFSLFRMQSVGCLLAGGLLCALLLTALPLTASPLLDVVSARTPENPAESSSVSTSSGGVAGADAERGKAQETGDRGDRSVTVDDVAHAEIQMLDRLTADLKNSPLAQDFDAEEERRRELVDQHLTDRQQMLKMVGCFWLVQQHHTENRPLYKAVVEKASPEKGMRQDEMLRLMFHGSWVACYQKFTTAEDVERLFLGMLSSQERLSSLLRGPETPIRFSKRQHHSAEQLIRRLAHISPANHKAINGFWGYTYAAVIILLLFFAILFLHRVLKTRRRRNGHQTDMSHSRKLGAKRSGKNH
uniref:Transmembrane protein n=1 Tax=Neospora caninum (strain Liverpool) TaxID=572307 RepID=A0A0F7UD87_NEOCL|nr:TPA: hypothetical protein BN1204_021540 [Neospora caninum Liverpool]